MSECKHVEIYSDRMGNFVCDTCKNKIPSMAVLLKYTELRQENTILREQVRELEKDCSFYRSCALGGEIPKEGSEPSAQNKYKKIYPSTNAR